MKVALKVVGGKNDGKEIGISIARFVIGRGETAHLRPASDLVSREHTAIEVKDGQIYIVDLDSRNGTFVNGNRITAPHLVEPGDLVRVGRLQFEMVIDQAQAGARKPRVANVVDAASRTVSSNPKTSLDDSITDWLLDAGDDPSTDEREMLKSADTIQLNFEDTTAIKEPLTPQTGSIPIETEIAPKEATSFFSRKPKQKPMKLPPVEKPKHDSSTAAADDVLKKFFNRR